MITTMSGRTDRAGGSATPGSATGRPRCGIAGTVALLITVGLTLAAGCASEGGVENGISDPGSGGMDESAPPSAGGDASGGGAAPDDADTATPDDQANGGEANGGEISTTDALDLVAADRDVVRTGTMRVTVEEVDDAVGEVRAVATAAGGFVADEQMRAVEGAADVTVSVPTDDFDDVRTAIAELGEVTEQDVQAEDVSADVVDLESRVASLRASVERMRGLLAEAGDVTQLSSVESELASRETELEALLGQQRVLADQVALGTLTVHLSEAYVAPEEPVESPDGFSDGFDRGRDVVVDAGRATLAAVGFAIPLVAPIAVVLVAALLWQRQRRRLRAAPVNRAAP